MLETKPTNLSHKIRVPQETIIKHAISYTYSYNSLLPSIALTKIYNLQIKNSREKKKLSRLVPVRKTQQILITHYVN